MDGAGLTDCYWVRNYETKSPYHLNFGMSVNNAQ